MANSGYLPTYGSKRAQELQIVRPTDVKLDLPTGAEMVTGELRSDVGQLEGRANKRGIFGGSRTPTDNLTRLEQTIRAPQGGTLTITAASTRAGTARARLELTEGVRA